MLKICFLPFVLLIGVFAEPQTKAPPSKVASPTIIEVDVPMHEWLNAYLDWAHHHPSVLKRDSSGDPAPLSLEMPYIELFSPAGSTIYRGGNDGQNAAFLNGLEHEIPSKSLVGMDRERPSLQEYLHMLSGLQPYEGRVLTERKPVIFAVTYRDNAMCKSQNAAIDHLKEQTDLQIVEIDLIH